MVLKSRGDIMHGSVRSDRATNTAATPGNNRPRRSAEFRCPGKYRVILTVIAGGLTCHNWNGPYFTACIEPLAVQPPSTRARGIGSGKGKYAEFHAITHRRAFLVFSNGSSVYAWKSVLFTERWKRMELMFRPRCACRILTLHLISKRFLETNELNRGCLYISGYPRIQQSEFFLSASEVSLPGFYL